MQPYTFDFIALSNFADILSKTSCVVIVFRDDHTSQHPDWRIESLLMTAKSVMVGRIYESREKKH